MHRILYLVQKEFWQILREKAYIGILFGMPLIQLVILGFAINTDVTNIPVAFVDLDRSAASRRVLDAVTVTDYFTYYDVAQSERQVKEWIDKGKVQLAIIIPPNFERDLFSGKRPKVQALIDGVDGNTAGIIQGYISQIAVRLQKDWLMDTGMLFHMQSIHLTELVPRMWYNPDLESRKNIVPGILGVLVTMITSFLTGMAIVREKEIGTLEQLMVTPIRKHELILGKIIPFVAVGFILLNVGILTAGFVFGIWMKGNIWILYGLSLVFMLSSLGVGIFASTMANTQQQAMFIVWFFSIFALLLSGFFIPIENMPHFIQIITYINPLRYFMIIIRELYLKGTPGHFLWKQALAMFIFGALTISLAALRFRKRIG